MEAWHDFFVAEAGASAALLGLLFVAISLNLTKIIEHKVLPNRAIVALLMLLAILVISSLLLIPEQTNMSAGVTVLIPSALLWMRGTRLDIRSTRHGEPEYRWWLIFHVFCFEISVLPYVVGAIMLLTGGAHPLAWVAAGMIFSFGTVVMDSWILLVEINR